MKDSKISVRVSFVKAGYMCAAWIKTHFSKFRAIWWPIWTNLNNMWSQSFWKVKMLKLFHKEPCKWIPHAIYVQNKIFWIVAIHYLHFCCNKGRICDREQQFWTKSWHQVKPAGKMVYQDLNLFSIFPLPWITTSPLHVSSWSRNLETEVAGTEKND